MRPWALAVAAMAMSGKPGTFGDTVYQATYGTIEKGIATYLSLIVAADPCASQVWLSRK